jgi:hypothetical protein
MGSLPIGLEPDRWVIRARGSTVRVFEVDPTALRIELDSGLEIQIEGHWRACIGAALDSPVADLGDGRQHVGASVLSLVLFDEGSVRLILSDALFLTANGDEGTKVSSELPGVYSWAASAGTLTTWLAEDLERSGATEA